jgi:hypothetical protein
MRTFSSDPAADVTHRSTTLIGVIGGPRPRKPPILHTFSHHSSHLLRRLRRVVIGHACPVWWRRRDTDERQDQHRGPGGLPAYLHRRRRNELHSLRWRRPNQAVTMRCGRSSPQRSQAVGDDSTMRAVSRDLERPRPWCATTRQRREPWSYEYDATTAGPKPLHYDYDYEYDYDGRAEAPHYEYDYDATTAGLKPRTTSTTNTAHLAQPGSPAPARPGSPARPGPTRLNQPDLAQPGSTRPTWLTCPTWPNPAPPHPPDLPHQPNVGLPACPACRARPASPFRGPSIAARCL